MDLAKLSIERPIFITCLALLSLIAGLMSMSRLGVDLFPDVTFPVVVVSTPYPGAGPKEIETLVSKPLEDEISTIAGIKRLTSTNQEGLSTVVAEFTLETDVKYAEQQVRDRVSATKRTLPTDIKEPAIRRVDPSDQPVLTLAIHADLPESKLFDLVDDKIRPRLEQVNQVGLVEIIGGRKREIHVALDRNKLKARELSALHIVNRIAGAGEDIPSGKKNVGSKELVFRTVGQFSSLDDIGSLTVNFFGNDVPIRINDIGQVQDTLEDETSRTYLNGKQSLFVLAFKQSGSNTIAVVEDLQKRITQLNKELETAPGKPQIEMVRDASKWIRSNVTDVKESIIMGVILAVVVVFLFLTNFRSTIITGLALPNSLIGAFILMAIAGFTINIMSLLALSLSVGLLIDDAIVVRENIFRHIELGKKPREAALFGTTEVRLAVIATTLTVIAVFGPLGFLKGVTGQFFKQFGLTICFAMAISLFDALTIAPMLSAYFAGGVHNTKSAFLQKFDDMQTSLENFYEKTIHYTLRHPFLVLFISTVVFVLSIMLTRYVPKTFLPPQDAGEFTVALDLPPGNNIEAMSETALKADEIIRHNPQVKLSAITVGQRDGDPNYADIYVDLVPFKERKENTSQIKDIIREQLKSFAYANPKVKDFDVVGGGLRPFTLNIMGSDQQQLEGIALAMLDKLKNYPSLKDVDVNFRPGKPEFQVVPEKTKMQMLGVSTSTLGAELRTQIEGTIAAKYREQGLEYDVRVRLLDDQRNLKDNFPITYVPNLNNSLIHLANVANPVSTEGPSQITRQDRNRYIQVNADITPGAGLGNIMNDVTGMLKNDIKLPKGVTYAFIGQAENFQELGESMAFAMGSGILFIYLVLSSLYESFIIPFTIMLALPLAICGSFIALFLAHQSLNIFSMIGMVMLLGVATKNSILLVDYAHQLTQQGMDRASAIAKAGKTRLRPILMTTMALIAGTMPIALGLNEASKQRTSMGIAIIGGLISSTILTLVVVPASYSFIDRFRLWSQQKLKAIFMSQEAK